MSRVLLLYSSFLSLKILWYFFLSLHWSIVPLARAPTHTLHSHVKQKQRNTMTEVERPCRDVLKSKTSNQMCQCLMYLKESALIPTHNCIWNVQWPNSYLFSIKMSMSHIFIVWENCRKNGLALPLSAQWDEQGIFFLVHNS